MGGSTLALMPRVAALSRYMGAPLSEDEILSEFRRYWWDAALNGGCAAQLVESWGLGDRVFWGSDFPGANRTDVIIRTANIRIRSRFSGHHPLVRQRPQESVS